jgi:hypothetical protein
MANSVTHSKILPIYGALFNVNLEFRLSTGATAAPTSPDTEVSLDDGTFADCTNEVTLIKEVGGSTDSAYGYITLTAAEMTADDVTLQSKSANCVTIGVNIRPERLVAVRTGTAQAGANTTITLDSGASAKDDIYNGYWIRTDGGTGAGQARQILDYNGSNKQATVRQWETNPSNDTTFTVGFVQSQAVNALSVPQTGDAYAVVAHADYGNAKLVRNAEPANPLNVAGDGSVTFATAYANTIYFTDERDLDSVLMAMESGTGVVLTDGAIKGSTFDNETAFPLTAEGGGAGGATAAEIWQYAQRTLSQPATSVINDPLAGNDITCIIATTLTVTWSGLAISATWSAIEFTAKKLLDGADSTALLQVLISNPGDGGDGLQRYMGLSGTAYKAKAGLTVNQAGGSVTLLVEDDVTILLSKQKVYYDVKQMLADGSSSILVSGTFDAVYTPTMTINL